MIKLRSVFQYSYIPGVMLAIAGLVAGLITQIWSPLYVGLLVAGVVILIGWLGFVFITAQGFWQRRSTQIGTNAIVATISLVAILCAINVLAVRYTTRIDLTENQLLTLSPQSQEIVKELKQSLKVWVFDSSPNKLDRELLENYRRYNTKFAFEFVDPTLQPGLVEQFKVKSLGDVFLEYGDKKQLVQTLIEFQQREPLSEIKLTNAIEKIQRDRAEAIYFLQGHGEYALTAASASGEGGLEAAATSLGEKGYKVEPLNLAERSTIPEDANAIAIVGAKRKFFDQEVNALKNFSNRGGCLFLAIDPDANLGLDPLLKEWGVQLDKRVIIDNSGAGDALNLGPATPIVTNYGDHPITKDFTNEYSIFPFAQAIGTVKAEGVTAVSLMITSENMWAESDIEAPELKFDDKRDLQGPFDLGIALIRKLPQTKATTPKSSADTSSKPQEREEKNERVTPTPSPNNQPKTDNKTTPVPSPEVKSTPSPSPNSPQNKQSELQSNPNATPEVREENKDRPKKTESRMVVIGNSAFATDSLFQDPRILNGDIFLNSMQWLAGDDEQTLSIRPKEAKNRRINLTPLQAGTIGWMSLIIMPLLGLTIAGVTWWRRR